MAEDVELFAGADFVGFQFHTFGGLQNRAESDADRVAHVFVHESGDGGLERGRETECLTSLREQRENAADGGEESHVEHAVGFVEDEDFNVAQVAELAVGKILQATGGGDDQRRAGAQALNLGFLGDAADDQGGFGHGLCAQVLVDLVDLHGQFARGQ